MTDHRWASEVEKEGLALWEAGLLVEAEQKYREALALLATGHWAVPHVRGGLANIISAQGRDCDAREQFQLTLSEALQLANGDSANPGVVVARYFYCEHLLNVGDAAGALAVISPGLGVGTDHALRLLEVRSHVALGEPQRAIDALRAALQTATTEEQRLHITSKLEELLQGEA